MIKVADSIRGFRNRYFSRNNQYTWLEWNAVWIDGEELFFASARDVTDNVRAEERARETNVLLQTVNKALTDYIPQQASQRLYERHAAGGMEFRNLDTLFGEVITSGKPVFANSPSIASRSLLILKVFNRCGRRSAAFQICLTCQ
ncbi:MAG: hypothetical protein AAB211_10685, partial [Pseudomonadota bacterium]